jgi:hypothetical protein
VKVVTPNDHFMDQQALVSVDKALGLSVSAEVLITSTVIQTM